MSCSVQNNVRPFKSCPAIKHICCSAPCKAAENGLEKYSVSSTWLLEEVAKADSNVAMGSIFTMVFNKSLTRLMDSNKKCTLLCHILLSSLQLKIACHDFIRHITYFFSNWPFYLGSNILNRFLPMEK